MAHTREFDAVVYGASGYTGRLVAEYLNSAYGIGGDVKWAMAGRSAEKLASVRDEIGIPDTVPLVVANADQPETIAEMAQRSACVITTVGPYQLYGEALVKACIDAGTDYVDLCGEPTWMHAMIDKYGSAAKASDARIVFSCGFDSIPSDLGIWYLQDQAKQKLGAAMPRVKGRVRAMNGKFSGGTAASLNATLAAAAKDPKVVDIMRNPFSLAQGFEGPKQPSGMKPIEEVEFGTWSGPFIMAAINTKNVHRSNALLGHPYGEDFVYDEMIFTGPGEQGQKMAEYLASTNILGGDDAPKPGEGPTKEERENGSYDIMFVGSNEAGKSIVASVKGDKDPGYGSTSKMLAEAALTLVKDGVETPGGIWTPASAMAAPLLKRLTENAGLTFAIES